ncbi:MULTISPECIES: UDP-N-acetylmuramate dehydrogenase [unclassified Psychrobacter]|uniref:UDP-N-acetylmuramate dehydrogenase n=1 Tax=unclassified Psychrobacter TaxID=196806 RepID=UPI002E0E3601
MALACVADSVVMLADEAQLDSFMASYQKTAEHNRPLFVLSGGSNVLLPAQLNAIVLRPQMRGITVKAQTETHVDIEVMAGENWHDLVIYTVEQGWYGLENLALIPGLTGAAPIQNIGAYGVQLEDCLQYVRAYHLPTGTWRHLSAIDCEFGYRDSVFKRSPNTWLISRVGFRLHLDPTQVLASYGDVQSVAQNYAAQNRRTQPTPADVMQAIIDIRTQKLPDPKHLPNCGSFFQNPVISNAQFAALQVTYPDIVGYSMPESMVKVAAGWLIEQAGLKGGGIAPILTHQQQALVLTNHRPYQATQKDVAQAQRYISTCVYNKFAITLSREPILVNADGSIGHGTHVV